MEFIMNKNEFIDAIATKSGLTKKDAGAALDATLETITETLASGDSVSFIGFGTFSVGSRAARSGVNPSTGAKLKLLHQKLQNLKLVLNLKILYGIKIILPKSTLFMVS